MLKMLDNSIYSSKNFHTPIKYYRKYKISIFIYMYNKFKFLQNSSKPQKYENYHDEIPQMYLLLEIIKSIV